MAFIVRGGAESAPNFPIPAPGQYTTVCAGVIDAGVWESEQWGPKSKVRVVFQVMDRGELKNIALFCTKSLHEKSNMWLKLHPWLDTVNREIDIDVEDPHWIHKFSAQIKGLTGMIQVGLNDKGRHIITLVMPGMDSQDYPAPQYDHPYILWAIEAGIKKGAIPNAANDSQPAESAGSDQDIPF